MENEEGVDSVKIKRRLTVGYKIFFNIDGVDLGAFCEKLSKIAPFLISSKIFYFWLDDESDKKKIEDIFAEMGIDHYFIQTLDRKDSEREPDFIKVWFAERFNEQMWRNFEETHQAELKKLNENIEAANKLLEDKIKKIKEGAKNGRGEDPRKEKEGKAEKDTKSNS